MITTHRDPLGLSPATAPHPGFYDRDPVPLPPHAPGRKPVYERTSWRKAAAIKDDARRGVFLKAAATCVRNSVRDAALTRVWLGMMLLSVRNDYGRGRWDPWLNSKGINRKTAHKCMAEALAHADRLKLCTIDELVSLYNSRNHRVGPELTVPQFIEKRLERERNRQEQVAAAAERVKVGGDPTEGDDDTHAGGEMSTARRHFSEPAGGREVQAVLFSDEQLRGALVVRRQVWSERVKREAIDAARAAEVEHAFRVLEREFGGAGACVGGQGRAETAGQRGTGRRHGAGTRTS